jgi:hypothetical protein
VGTSERFDVLATCLEPDEAARIYPPARLPGLRLLHVLTGYVSDEMLTLAYPPTDKRPIDVGYRGSLQPWHFGRLAYEKRNRGLFRPGSQRPANDIRAAGRTASVAVVRLPRALQGYARRGAVRACSFDGEVERRTFHLATIRRRH